MEITKSDFSFRMSESIKALVPALIAMQGDIVPLKRDKTNPFFKSSYVGLESVLPAALSVANKHDIAIIQTVGTAPDGATTLSTTLLHTSGEWLSDTQPLLLTKADPQGQGSAITYARRYGVMAALGIVGEEDDDGNAASPPVKRPSAPRQKPQGRDLPPSTAAAYADGQDNPAQPSPKKAPAAKPAAGRECVHEWGQTRTGAMACVECGEMMPHPQPSLPKASA